VVGGEQDKFTPGWLSKKMADTIPGARFLMVPGGSHTAPLEAPNEIWAAVKSLLETVHEREAALTPPKAPAKAKAPKNAVKSKPTSPASKKRKPRRSSAEH
jgi:hypothetical protein